MGLAEVLKDSKAMEKVIHKAIAESIKKQQEMIKKAKRDTGEKIMTTIYEKLSNERKQLQARGECPDWFTTGGYQLFKDKYLHDADGLRDTYLRIAKTMAKHTNDVPKYTTVIL